MPDPVTLEEAVTEHYAEPEPVVAAKKREDVKAALQELADAIAGDTKGDDA